MINETRLWRLKKADGMWDDSGLEQVETSVRKKQDIVLYRQVYRSRDGKNEFCRIHIKAGACAGFLIDQIHTQEETCVYTDFELKNQDGKTWCNVPDKHRLVVRDAENGMKHFRFFCRQDEKDVKDTAGLLLPDRIGKDYSIGYSMYEGLYHYGKEHFSCFGYLLSDQNSIKLTHFSMDGNKIKTDVLKDSKSWVLEVAFPVLRLNDSSEVQSMIYHMEKDEIL